MGATYIDYLRMEPADNGVVLSWDEISPSKTGETYAPGCRISRKEVYDFDEDESEGEEMKKAMTRFMELYKQSKQKKD